MTSLDTVAGTQMKITARSEELADVLAVAGRGVSTRATVHVLTGILLRAEGDRLAVAATDMELSLRRRSRRRAQSSSRAACSWTSRACCRPAR
jgi:DNA polymerase III sliding clamp (beta) subunit (PCNA family)